MAKEFELKEVLNLGDKFCIPFQSIRAIKKITYTYGYAKTQYYVQFEVTEGYAINCDVKDEKEQDAIYKEAVAAFEHWLINKGKENDPQAK